MNTLKNNTLLYINDSNFVLCNPYIDELISKCGANLSILYFTSNPNNTNHIQSILNSHFIDKILLVSNSKKSSKIRGTTFRSKITTSALHSLTHNILILIDNNDDYDFLKFVINNLKLVLNLSNQLGINLHHLHNTCPIICAIINNNSTYLDDLLNCIKAILIKNESKQYAFIYDTVCNYLDSQFHNCNLCDFKNDQCVANRAKRTAHEFMGCCYSFTYANLLDFRFLKDIKLCQYMHNRTCTTKNITCKLFTCNYLKEQNIKFDTHKILLLDCFFNKKQHDIIQSNFFKTREEILQKLQEKNHDLYYWYILRQKYRIKG